MDREAEASISRGQRRARCVAQKPLQAISASPSPHPLTRHQEAGEGHEEQQQLQQGHRGAGRVSGG